MLGKNEEDLLGDLDLGPDEDENAKEFDIGELDAPGQDTPKAEGSVAAPPAEAAVAEKAESPSGWNSPLMISELDALAAEDKAEAKHQAQPPSEVGAGETSGAIDLGEQAVGDLKTIRKRARYLGRGWARFRKDEIQKRWRDKKKAKAPAPIAKPPRFPVDEVALDMPRHLKSWTRLGETHRASALQGYEDRLVSALEKYLQMERVMGQDPSYPEFAKRMRWSERKARRTIGVLGSLFDVGGPWHRP